MNKYSFREVVIDSRTGLNPRQNFKLGSGNNYYITIKDIHDGRIEISEKTDRVDDKAIAKIKKRSRIKNGDILFTSIGRIGETVIVRDKDDTWDVNESIFVFTINTEIVNLDYFCILLKSASIQERLNKDSSGSTFKSIKMNQLEKLVFSIPTLKEQSTIANRILTINHLLELQSNAYSKLDELIKSRFVEMFGIPEANPHRFDEINISKVLRGKVSNGFFAKRDDYVDDGNVMILGVSNIVNRMYSNCNDLPKTNANTNDIQKYGVQYGDMLFCRSSLVAEGIGKASIVPENVPVNTLFECHVIRLPLDITKVVPEYIQVLSTMDYFRNQVLSSAKTATMTTIGQDGILKCNIILPPYEKQKEYLLFIKQVERQKATVHKSIDRLETLKKSLMQECFG